MKRALAGFLAGVFCITSLISVAACADKPDEPNDPDDENVQIDRDAPAYTDADATLTVDATTDANSARISEDLFGLFLEDINYASYALDDNMIADSSFDRPATGKGHGWSPLTYWKTGGGLSLNVTDTATGRLYKANKYYASVTSAIGGTLSNTGFEATPIAVESGVDYIVSLFVKSGKAFDLTATIRGGGADLGHVVIPVEQNEKWVKYEYTLTATETASSGLTLELAFGAAVQNVLIDSVRLETTRSTAGIKNYIYDVLADMSPKFLRFPGGCIIEGSSMETAYDWKNSVGAVAEGGDDEVDTLSYKLIKDGVASDKSVRGSFETRTPNTNLWAYNSNDAKNHYYLMDYSIGFYEYFILCESLGAKPIPILNCGLSCQIQVGDSGKTENILPGRHPGYYTDNWEDYIQDAKDLVYFALGSADSSDKDEAYWAQLRVDMGHEKPFDLEYLGIGNEQWSSQYYTYYQKFLEAFAAESNPLFKQVKLIVGNGPNFDQTETVDETGKTIRAGEALSRMSTYINKSGTFASYSDYGIVDHHYYMGYLDFFLNTHFYDNYRRGGMDGYEVFVGEYSANDQSHPSTGGDKDGKHNSNFAHTNNSWITALSEAAYMTGLERNGDVVRLAAYAPMFAIASGAGISYNPPANNWHANMLLYTNTKLVLTPNYYIQQAFMKNQGDLLPASTALSFAGGGMPTTEHSSVSGTPLTVTIDNVYYVVSVEEATGDVIVKIVNAGEDALKFNVKIDSVTLRGYAMVTEMYSDAPTDVSTLDRGNIGYPEYFNIGIMGDTLGYEIQPYSVTVLRVRTK